MKKYRIETTEEIKKRIASLKGIIGVADPDRTDKPYISAVSISSLLDAMIQELEQIQELEHFKWFVPDDISCPAIEIAERAEQMPEEITQEVTSKPDQVQRSVDADPREDTRKNEKKELGEWKKYEGLQLSSKKAHYVTYKMTDEGYSVKQINDLLQVSDQTVRNWISKRDKFEEENGKTEEYWGDKDESFIPVREC